MPYCFAPLAAIGRKAGKLRKNSLCAALLAASTFVSAQILEPDCADAAMPTRLYDLPGNQAAASQELLAPIDVIQTISGSPYPGIVDCLLQRPLEEAAPEQQAAIHINYPSIGNRRVDSDIRDWVTGMADAFTSHLDLANDKLNTLLNVDESIDLISSGEDWHPKPDSTPGTFELWGAYKVSRPSPAAISIAFELWNYTGAPEGNLDIITLNYSLITGQRLNFVDIFEKPEVALELMSSWSRKKLIPRLGAASRPRMLEDGTAPIVENFSSITLIPEGICINFQPWQVAPSDAGIQKVLMPLEELLPSAPLLALWGKGEPGDEHASID